MAGPRSQSPWAINPLRSLPDPITSCLPGAASPNSNTTHDSTPEIPSHLCLLVGRGEQDGSDGKGLEARPLPANGCRHHERGRYRLRFLVLQPGFTWAPSALAPVTFAGALLVAAT